MRCKRIIILIPDGVVVKNYILIYNLTSFSIKEKNITIQKNIMKALKTIDKHTYKVQKLFNNFGQGNSAKLFLKTLLNQNIWQLSPKNNLKT